MEHTRPSSAASLSDQQLLVRVKDLARSEREVTVNLVVHLAELDERKLYLGEGCASLFSYCVEILHLSENAAYARIQAARAARKCPALLAKLAAGSMNLTTVGLLAPHLKETHGVDLLAAAENKSKREVEELIAALRPQPAVAASMRKLPSRAARVSPQGTRSTGETGAPGLGPLLAEKQATASTSATASHTDASGDAPPGARDDRDTPRMPGTPGAPGAPGARPMIAPLARDLYKVQFTVDGQTYAMIRRAQELLRHQVPNGDLASVMGRAVASLVAQLEKRKFAALGAAPTNAKSGARSHGSANGATRNGHTGTVPDASRHGADALPRSRAPRARSLGGQRTSKAGGRPATNASGRPATNASGRPATNASGRPATNADRPATNRDGRRATSSRGRSATSVNGHRATSSGGRRSRYIPAAVRRQVWQRDGGRCAFVSADGRRCSERGHLEFDHAIPHGDRGKATLDNIQLRCAAHNRYAADLYFGPGTSSIRRRRSQAP
jgi:hypothetical protein